MSSKKPAPPVRMDNDKKDIKEIAKKAIAEHEELQRKYSKKEEQTKQLVEELEQTREILSKLESVSGQVVQEYVDTQTKLDIEQQCREEAEKIAAKTVREIKELKRKSQMVFAQNGIDFSQIVDISIDDEPGDTSLEEGVPEPSHHAKEYQAQIELLKDELFSCKKDVGYAMDERDLAQESLAAAYTQIAQLKEQIKQETISHEKTKKALQERDNIINQLKRVSTLVYNEFNEVQSLYEKESAMREEAERMASQYYAKNKEAEAYKRQSAMMMSDAIGGDDKLIQSMTEMEQLTKELEEERENHKLEVKRLRDELELSESREKMEMLENKLSIAKEENEALEKKVQDLDLKTKELAYELKEALSKPSLPNIPPPPPPPPVPTLPKNPLEMLQKIIHRRNNNRKIENQEDGRNLDRYQKQFETAMQDMITRIKRGQIALRPVNREEERPMKKKSSAQSIKTKQAVKELDDILVTLKNKNRNRGRIPPPRGTNETQPDSEFKKIMEQRLERSKGPPPTSARPSPKPTSNTSSSPRYLISSTSLDSGLPPHRTTNVPPVAPKRSPLTTITSIPPNVPEPIYSTVHQEDPSPPSTPSSTLSSIISTSSQEMEIQNNPAFIHDSGDERSYASADFIPPPPPDSPAAAATASSHQNRTVNPRFTIRTDFGESGDYSLVEERSKPVPSPRRQPSVPRQEPEPYYSEVNL